MDNLVIGMCATNEEDTIGEAILSVLHQQGLKRELTLLISIDNGTQGLNERLAEFQDDPRIIVEQGVFGQAYANRNFIIETSLILFPDGCILGRLDADDLLCDEWVLSKIEEEWDAHTPDVLFSGNRQRDDAGIRQWINYADARLLDPDYLRSRLEGMAAGIATTELPSCNTFFSNLLPFRYPAVDSAEDHWFSVLLLLNKEKIRIHFAEQVLYCIYSVSGQSSHLNQKTNLYLPSRQNLLRHFISTQHGNR